MTKGGVGDERGVLRVGQPFAHDGCVTAVSLEHLTGHSSVLE